MTVKINGVDITDYIAFRGFKWTRNDVDSPDTGRMLDGNMERTRVATKVRLDVTCRPLLLSEASDLLSAIMPVLSRYSTQIRRRAAQLQKRCIPTTTLRPSASRSRTGVSIGTESRSLSLKSR